MTTDMLTQKAEMSLCLLVATENDLEKLWKNENSDESDALMKRKDAEEVYDTLWCSFQSSVVLHRDAVTERKAETCLERAKLLKAAEKKQFVELLQIKAQLLTAYNKMILAQKVCIEQSMQSFADRNKQCEFFDSRLRIYNDQVVEKEEEEKPIRYIRDPFLRKYFK